MPVYFWWMWKRLLTELTARKLIKKLHKVGIRGKFLASIESFINNRKQNTKINDVYSSTRTTKNGLPQGGVISLVCFLLYMNDITTVIEHSTPSLFVDDLSLITHAKRPSALCRKIQTDLDKIEKWSSANQMIFAPSKFHIINISLVNKKTH